MTESIAYLNGEFLPLSQTKISVLDRGFLFADGIYEVIPVFNRKPFRLEEHLIRLNNSLEKIKLINPHSQNEWMKLINTLIEKNNGLHQSIYLQITRGVASERNHAFPPPSVMPSIFLMSTPLTVDNSPTQPIHAITCEDIRWQYCDIKSIALLPNILLRQQAVEQGAQEAILIRNGHVTEGAASNVFIVKNNKIFTPHKNQYILGGITRDLIVELAHKNKLHMEETTITAEELQTADEIWVTSSTKEILPVGKLDDKLINQGQIGPIYLQMIDYYQVFKAKLLQ